LGKRGGGGKYGVCDDGGGTVGGIYYLFFNSFYSLSLFTASFLASGKEISPLKSREIFFFFHLVGGVGYAFERTFGSMDFCLCLHPHTHTQAFF